MIGQWASADCLGFATSIEGRFQVRSCSRIHARYGQTETPRHSPLSRIVSKHQTIQFPIMQSTSLFRLAARAARAPTPRLARFQTPARFALSSQTTRSFSASVKVADVDAHDPHHEESFEEFTARSDPSLLLHHRALCLNVSRGVVSGRFGTAMRMSQQTSRTVNC